MSRLSLRLRLALFWFFTVVVALALAALLFEIYDQGANAQIRRGRRLTEDACAEIQRKFAWGVKHHSFEKNKEAQFQGALLEIILEHYTGAEGGFWNARDGFINYAFPTYEGSSVKYDVPPAEKKWIQKIAEAAVTQTSTDTVRGQREAIVVSACPIAETSVRTAAWVMSRLPIGSGILFEHFAWALSLLLLFVISTGLGASWLLLVWSKDLRQLEDSIRHHSPGGSAKLPASREPELQNIVTAFDELNARFRVAQENAEQLTRRLAQADRLAVLGKLAAGFAHEIRNPMATARLKIENAALDPAKRMAEALPVITEQMDRVDRLVQMLLAMTQPFELVPEKVNLPHFFQDAFPVLRTEAAERGIRLTLTTEVDHWCFDVFHLSRALENLVQNALAHTPRGGTISVHASAPESLLQIDIKDSGAGIAEKVKPRLFEPFASGREGGTGLGLLLVKEIVEAHGGTITERGDGAGAHFHLELPWLKS